MRKFVLVAGVAATAVAARKAYTNSPTLRRRMRRSLRRAESAARGRVLLAMYRRTYGHPDLNVDGKTLADRARSQIGPLLHSLDLPHVHVMAEGHTVLLHGDVANVADALDIELAAASVPGVDRVASHLHVGLLPSDTRPSAGRELAQHSPAWHRLVDALALHGVGAADAEDALQAILTPFFARLPREERRHVLAHLPADVRSLAPVRRACAHARSHAELVAAAALASPAVDRAGSDQVVAAVLDVLRHLVPEEVFDVAAVLPPDLRATWLGAAAPTWPSASARGAAS